MIFSKYLEHNPFYHRHVFHSRPPPLPTHKSCTCFITCCIYLSEVTAALDGFLFADLLSFYRRSEIPITASLCSRRFQKLTRTKLAGSAPWCPLVPPGAPYTFLLTPSPLLTIFFCSRQACSLFRPLFF